MSVIFKKKDKRVFQYVNAVSYSKVDMMRNTDNDDLAQRGYNAFITNRLLSYFQDSILQANEMNEVPHLDNLLQFDYFINSLRKRKRFKEKDESKSDFNNDLNLVMEYFGYSRAKAEVALSILSSEDISEIYKITNKGGLKNEQREYNKGPG